MLDASRPGGVAPVDEHEISNARIRRVRVAREASRQHRATSLGTVRYQIIAAPHGNHPSDLGAKVGMFVDEG
jgi:hypothetical protein